VEAAYGGLAMFDDPGVNNRAGLHCHRNANSHREIRMNTRSRW
jgi:hypothetical protein